MKVYIIAIHPTELYKNSTVKRKLGSDWETQTETQREMVND